MLPLPMTNVAPTGAMHLSNSFFLRNLESLQSKRQQKIGSSKNLWTEEEDQLLEREVLAAIGSGEREKPWSEIAAKIPGRVGKQCRDRWRNHLCPDVKKGSWSKGEDKILFEKHKEHGNQWSEIAKHLPGRTDLSVKNRFYSHKRKANRQVARISTKSLPVNTAGGSGNTLLQNSVLSYMEIPELDEVCRTGIPPIAEIAELASSSMPKSKHPRKGHDKLQMIAVAVATAVAVTKKLQGKSNGKETGDAQEEFDDAVAFKAAVTAAKLAIQQDGELSPVQRLVPAAVRDPVQNKIRTIEEHVSSILRVQTGTKTPKAKTVQWNFAAESPFRRMNQSSSYETESAETALGNVLTKRTRDLVVDTGSTTTQTHTSTSPQQEVKKRKINGLTFARCDSARSQSETAKPTFDQLGSKFSPTGEFTKTAKSVYSNLDELCYEEDSK